MLALKTENHSTGFTLIELLIVIALVAGLSAITLPIYGNWREDTEAREAAAQIVGALRFAQIKSTAAYQDAEYGVYFEDNDNAPDRMIAYKGPSYAGREENEDRAMMFDNTLSLETDFPGNDLNFIKYSGRPNATGAVRILRAGDVIRTISVNDLGLAEENNP